MSGSETPVVLVVEDEPDVAETYRRWLESTYEIRVAPTGTDALEQVDESVDVVLLDRMMPELSGGEVLARIREEGIDCRVAMVTAVDPDFDVVEMGFDAYVTKPPDREELVEVVETLLDRASLDAELQQYYSLVARRSTLEAEKPSAELSASEEYAELVDEIESKRQVADASLGDMSSDTEFVGAVREIEPDEESSESDDSEEATTE